MKDEQWWASVPEHNTDHSHRDEIYEAGAVGAEIDRCNAELKALREENAYLRKLVGLRDKEVLFEEEEE